MLEAANETAFDEFWEDLVLEAGASGEPQHAAFFQLYGALASENGDCADLIYTPVKRDGAKPYQIDGYAFDRDRGELHVAICDFRHDRDIETLNAERMQQLFNRAKRFLECAIDTDFVRSLEETSAAFEVANQIAQNRDVIKRVRCVLFSNARLSTRKKSVEAGEVFGVPITFNVIDFLRYHDIQRAQGGVEPVELDVAELNGDMPLPCLNAHAGEGEYESYLIVVPGDLLARIYGIYGARLMEQNVRTFLQARTKANKGIITTASDEPEMFFAYNNGITATATAVEVSETPEHGRAITKIEDLQIVNGGQTTASLLYAKDKQKADLSKVFVQMKLSVVQPERVDEVVPLISRFANTQNRISEADFFSSHPFHIEMQKMSRRMTAPAAEGAFAGSKWFYERARGQYRNEQASRTPAEKRRFETEFPRSQVFQKTDLAKFHLTFRAQPHVVSRGAQKCFLEFAKEISKKWEKGAAEYNDRFFRWSVARALVFRWVDKMVGQSSWYQEDRGYKANIVTYTIAWTVARLSESNSQAIDLEQIWKKQAVPPALQDVFSAVAPRVAAILKSPPPGVTNVSEYAKTQGCWARVQGSEFDIPDDLGDAVVSLETIDEARKTGRAERKIDLEIEFERQLFGLVGQAGSIETIARRYRMLSPLSTRALGKLGRGNLSLTKSESNSLQNLFERLRDRGVDIGGMEEA
ncbi:MAG: AIPR family protein [Maricaulis sp.]|uniref:AIPR family protein n=1 Tax=Maricaulis sp. TaxID=1486257 RepID=UPI001B1A381F|nr:AIPR family protein [Maricaulis sp.]MBO6729970.1 AIPR family protein [Maricaulis sp.]MBO6878300.1 AIPR family protein [Maricaulis sp.]